MSEFQTTAEMGAAPCVGSSSRRGYGNIKYVGALVIFAGWTVCSYMSRLPGADMDLSSRLLGHSKGLLNERFLNIAFTKI